MVVDPLCDLCALLLASDVLAAAWARPPHVSLCRKSRSARGTACRLHLLGGRCGALRGRAARHVVVGPVWGLCALLLGGDVLAVAWAHCPHVSPCSVPSACCNLSWRHCCAPPRLLAACPHSAGVCPRRLLAVCPHRLLAVCPHRLLAVCPPRSRRKKGGLQEEYLRDNKRVRSEPSKADRPVKPMTDAKWFARTCPPSQPAQTIGALQATARTLLGAQNEATGSVAC